MLIGASKRNSIDRPTHTHKYMSMYTSYPHVTIGAAIIIILYKESRTWEKAHIGL